MPRPEENSTRLPSLRDAERAHIIRVLEATEWNKLEAAKVLDISRGTLYRKIDEYGLEPSAGSEYWSSSLGRAASAVGMAGSAYVLLSNRPKGS